MNKNEIGILLQKADELRSLFVLGQRVIPFLEEIFVFVRDIQPLLDEINVSINENMKKMPGASEKLSKVTEANELATTEIMDTLDRLFDKTSKISKNNKSIHENYDKIFYKPLRLLEILRSGIISGEDLKAAIPQIDSAINKLKSFEKSNILPFEQENTKYLQDIEMDASAIMMSLQVQDISSQQIAAVDHMLRTVQDKLSTILKHFSQVDMSSLTGSDKESEDDYKTQFGTNTTKFHREIAFDPNAIQALELNSNRQNDVDALINMGLENIQMDDIQAIKPKVEDVVEESNSNITFEVNETQDQDDINALFSSGLNFDDQGDVESNFETNEEDVLLEDEEINETQNQDDIDALFNTSSEENSDSNEDEFDYSKFDDLDENLDPDDIDALFSKG